MAHPEALSKAGCSQLFTELHGEFTFGNDTVTATYPACRFHNTVTANRKPGRGCATRGSQFTSIYAAPTRKNSLRLSKLADVVRHRRSR